MSDICLLGIDPGSQITGYGVIRLQGRGGEYVASGSIRVGKLEWSERLRDIFNGVSEIIRQYQPQALVIEKVFLHRNADAALKLGQARGVAIAAAAVLGLAVHEYSPNEVKQAIVGGGHADKTQVQHMIRILLNLSEAPPPDAADALALALCHAHRSQSPLPAAVKRRSPGRRASWRDYKPS
jgi:crossover junction endodeoxyribonuclease RuvC